MASHPNYIEIRVVIVNERALRALVAVEEYLEEEADGRDWDAGLARALRAVRYAQKHLTAREKDE